MCPYTRDGTLAEWTYNIISAKIGETAGSVAMGGLFVGTLLMGEWSAVKSANTQGATWAFKLPAG